MAMHSLLSICAGVYDIVFIAKKAEVFIFLRERRCKIITAAPKPFFKMSGGAIKFLHKWRHLGLGNTLLSFIFNVFVNAFIVKLRLLDVGCHINNQDD